MTRAAHAAEFYGTSRFELLGPLAVGRTKSVFKVRDRETDSVAALKLLDTPTDESLLRFKREFRLLQSIQHPNLVSLGELAEADGTWFYTMELVEGVDMLSYVRDSHGAPDELRLRDVVAQLSRALVMLHRSRKVHCHVEPANTVVTGRGRLVLLEFGLSLEVGRTDVAMPPGERTGDYAAPEQRGGEPVTAAADCYAVGVVLYEALVGNRPDPDAPEPPRQHKPDVPTDLDRLCMDLLQQSPAGRPRADDILARLGKTESDSGSMPVSDSVEVFVGRSLELRRLLAASRTTTGGKTLVVTGPSGVGKTALVRQFVQKVVEVHDHTLVLSGRCFERESVPFKGVDGVVDDLAAALDELSRDDAAMLLPEHAALLAQVFPALGRLEVFRDSSESDEALVSAHERRRRAFFAMRELLGYVSQQRRVVISVDDIQWASEDTWTVLDHIVQPPDAPPVLLVMTMRSEIDSATDLLDRLPGPVETVVVDALSPDEAKALARRLLAHAGREDAADPVTLAREAEGQPFFIRQLVQHVVETGTAGEARLHDALGVGFDRLSPDAFELLNLVAVAGGPLPHATMAQAVGAGYADYQRRVRELESAHMVRSRGTRGADSIEHYHDRIREAATSALSEDRKKILHTRLANALEASGHAERAPEIAVRHLAAAGYSLRAAYHAETAAQRAVDALAFEQAATLFRTALDLGTHESGRERALTLALCDALVNAGRGAEAADLYLVAAQTGTVAERLDLQRAAAEQLLLSGHIARGVDVLGDVLKDVGEALPKTPGGALASLLWQRAVLRLRGLRWRARDVSEIAPRDLIECDVYRTVGSGLAIVDNIRGADYQCRFLRRALALGEPERVIHALSFESALQAAQGNRRGRRIARRLEQWASESGDLRSTAWARLAAAGIAIYMDNDWLATLKCSDEGEHLLRRHFHHAGWETDTARLFRCFALLHLGQFDHLGRLVHVYVRDAATRGDRYLSVNVRTRLVMPWLAADDAVGALADLKDALSQWVPWTEQFLVQHFFALHSLCEIALYEGDADHAASHMAEQFDAMKGSLLLRLNMPRAEVDHLRGRIALARGQIEDARRFARSLTRNSLPAPKLWAALLRAGASRRDGDSAGAKRQLRSAIEQLDRTNNRAYAMAARSAHGGALAADAEAWAAHNGVANLAKLTALLVPGFK